MPLAEFATPSQLIEIHSIADIHIREASNPGGEVPKLLRRLDLPRDVTQWQNEDGEVGHIYERDPESEPLNARFFRNLKFKIQRKVGGAGWYVAQHLHQHNMYHPPRDLQAEEDFQ